MQRLNEAWERMSPREQRLALVVAGLLLCVGALTGIRGAMAHVRDLDTQIESLQDTVVNNTMLIATREQVEQQYRRVAKQHSSVWKGPEIHDRLRQEVMRLAEKVPPELNAEGVPEQVTSPLGPLLKIPAIGEGQLLEGGDGYRQYSLRVTIPDAEFNDLVAFLARLQDSPQSLRIQQMMLVRNAENKQCSADISIVRTIADLGEEVSEEPEEGKEAPGPDMQPSEWSATGGALESSAEYAGAGRQSLKFTASAPEAQAYTLKNLIGGATYEFTMDITALTPARLGIRDKDGLEAFAGEAVIRDEGRTVQYRAQFTVPGAKGSRMQVRVPCVFLEKPGDTVHLDGYALSKVSE